MFAVREENMETKTFLREALEIACLAWLLIFKTLMLVALFVAFVTIVITALSFLSQAHAGAAVSYCFAHITTLL
jgi:hypothetical protein